MGKMKNSYNILVEIMKKRDHLGDPDGDGRIMFKCVSK
jgi:hypothetical protein